MTLPQSDIAALYDSLAWIYDAWAFLTESRARRRALEMAGIRDGQTVLEVAVGTGIAFREIVARNPHGRNVGVDISRGMLAKAKKRLRALAPNNYELRVGSALDLELDSESVDVLMNCYMFDLLSPEDTTVVLAEFRRVLKAGARIVVVNMTKGERKGSGLYERIYRLSPRLLGGCRPVELARQLAQTGFELVTREYRQQLLFPSEIIVADKPAA